jgi:N-acetylmuramoyl-L-alanine amidase
MTDLEVRTALTDREAFLVTLWGEARAEPIEGKVAVASVIVNRWKAPRRYGSTIKAVCHARAQFSCWWRFGGATNYQAVMQRAAAVAAGQTFTDPFWRECEWVVDGLLGGAVRSRVGTSTHYLTTALLKAAPPEWAIGKKPAYVVAAHSFYEGIA